MCKVARILQRSVKALTLLFVGLCLFIVRSLLKTPQPLESVVPGEAHLYKWVHGHIFYKVAGADDAPPIVLLHAPEIGGSSYEMRHIVAGLAEHSRVYVLDLLGFGLSDRPRIAYAAHTYVTLCQDFLTDVVRQPAVLLGSGWSGNYCIEVAAHQPELCRGVVLLSPLSLIERRTPPAWLVRFVENRWMGLVLYALLTARSILRGVIAWQHHCRYWQIPPEELDSMFASAHQLGAQYAALAFLLGKLDLDVESHLAPLPVPILLIRGLSGGLDVSLPLMNRSPQRSAHSQSIGYPQAPLRVHEANPEEIVETIQEWQAKSVSNEEHIQAYCVKCRQKRPLHSPKRVTTKSGRHALEGLCPVCGSKLFRFTAK